MTTVLLVDDHSLIRAGLATLIDSTGDLQVVGQAADGEQALAVALECTPDVILMDISMPVVDGIEATRRVLAALPETKVVVLTSFSDRAQVDRALQAGAIGYVLKDCDPLDLVAAVRSAAAGHAPIDPRVTRPPAQCPRFVARRPAECPGDRGATTHRTRHGEQADRSRAGYPGEHGEGARWKHLPCHRRERSHECRPLGARAPARGIHLLR